MKKRLLSIVLAVILSLSFVNSAFAMSYHENDIENYIIGQLSNAKIPGGEVSIVTSGKEVYSASYGDVPETDSDLRIGSLSRIFTSISILQLADSKKITLATNISDIISGSDKLSGITVEDLLRQTGGYTTTQKIESDSIPAPLGKKGKYQDARINYAILGKVVEEVSGLSYADYIQKNIVKPLQLESTYTIDEMAGKDIVGGHDNLFGLPIARKAESSYAKGWDAVSATGIVSDAKDLGNVLSMFLAAGGKTLSYDQIEKVYSDGTGCGNTIFDTEGTSSLGWIKTKVGGQDVYYVSGAIDGYISSAFLVPGQDLGITMLFDTSDVVSGNDVIEELMSNVVRLAIGEKARTIDSKAVMLPHIEFDIVYVLAFLVSLIPMILMSWWYRATRKNGVEVARTVVDAVVHIGMPIVVYKSVPVIIENVLGNSLGSWFMIKKFLPECYYVTILIEIILLAGIPIKIISAVIAMKKGPFTDEEETDESNISEEEDVENIEESEENISKEADEIEESEESAQEQSDENEEKAAIEKETDNIEEDTEPQKKEVEESQEDAKEDNLGSVPESDKTEEQQDDVTQEVAATTEEKSEAGEENVEIKTEHKEKVKQKKKHKKKNRKPVSAKTVEENEKEVKQKEEKNKDDESEEIIKEFKTRKKKPDKEEYGSSFEREAVKALEDNESIDKENTDDDLSDMKSDPEMQTAVPEIKKKYYHQKGMPVKIVVEPDDELDD